MESPRSKGGFKYLLVIQDLFTRYLELKPLRRANGKAVADALEELIFFRWEVPDFLLTDNGYEFINKTLKTVLDEYGVHHVTTPPYHPQANLVERSNRMLKTLIAIYAQKDHREWDRHLPELRQAINTSVQSTTKVSPAYLNFGRHPQQPKSLRREVEARGPKIRINPSVWVDRVRHLDALRDLVAKHIDKAFARQTRAYDKGRKVVSFKEGDLVLRKTHPLSDRLKGRLSKLAPKFDGPFRIAKILGPDTYSLDLKGGRSVPKVHSEYLQLYKPTKPTPDVVANPTPSKASTTD
uniref:Integrase catalytic domain-containing protein n=1 Tax=Trichogramma kaykai TaxID=54128 RepID=A0ABD2XIF1_9HYME